MNVFVAASWDDRVSAKIIAEVLRKRGTEVTAEWWLHEDPNKSEQWCREDFDNMKRADALVIYNTKRKTTGKIVELGMAIMREIPIVVVGEPITSVYRHRISAQLPFVDATTVSMFVEDLVRRKNGRVK